MPLESNGSSKKAGPIGQPSETLSPHLIESLDDDAVRHLFKVASGLDSLIIGVSEILGQVRESLTIASDAESVRFEGQLFFRQRR